MGCVRAVLGGLIGMAAWGFASRAHAGMEFGARVGFGIPYGSAADIDGGKLSNFAIGMVPLQLDIGYRVIPRLMLGGYVMYGFGLNGVTMKEPCKTAEYYHLDATCRVHDIRVGIQGQFHFSPGQSTDPWMGVGLGYEWFVASVSSERNDITLKLHGPELLNLQGGADFRLPMGFTVGPYASLALGRYASTSWPTWIGDTHFGEEGSGSIENKALHGWLMLGARGTFSL